MGKILDKPSRGWEDLSKGTYEQSNGQYKNSSNSDLSGLNPDDIEMLEEIRAIMDKMPGDPYEDKIILFDAEKLVKCALTEKNIGATMIEAEAQDGNMIPVPEEQLDGVNLSGKDLQTQKGLIDPEEEFRMLLEEIQS